MKEKMTLYLEELRQEQERVRIETEQLIRDNDDYEKRVAAGVARFNTLADVIVAITEITGGWDD